MAVLGCDEEALAAYDQALRLNPSYPQAYHNRGSSLAKLGRYVEALEIYDAALGLDPTYPQVYNSKGNSLFEFGRYEEALKTYDQALQLDPNDALIYNNKGLALAELERYEEALVFKPPTPVERSAEEMQELMRRREERAAYLRRSLELGYAGPGIRRRLQILAIISLFVLMILIILTGGKVDFSNQAVLNIVLIIVLLLTLLIFLVYGLLQLIVFSIRLVHVIREERQSLRNRLPSSHERDDRA